MPLKDLSKRYPLLTQCLYALAALAAVLLVLHLAFAYFLPFVIAILIAGIMEPPVRFLERHRLPRGAAVALVMAVYFSVLLAAAFLVASRLAAEAGDFSKNLPEYGRFLSSLFHDVSLWGKKLYLRLPQEIVGPLQDSILSLAGHATQALTALAGTILRMLSSLPDLLMFFMFTMISTFFISRDRRRLRESISGRLPARTYDKLAALKKSLAHSLVGFLKAQAMLLSLTFAQCFIGLSLIGIRYALVISIFTALVDIMPVLGTGTVFIPWGAACLAIGKTRTGAYLLLLYLVIMIVRYIVEPKIIGSQLGLHPLLSLVAMFVGLRALGVVGLILGPAVVVAVQAIMKSGLLPPLKE
jgi:sporulation integral membrane protein YtvI